MIQGVKTVAVLYGGTSPEAKVSDASAKAIWSALESLGYEVHKINLSSPWVKTLAELLPDYCFIAGHGAPSEDGTVQAVLESLNIPYNGSGVLASALCMNKSMAKVHCMLAGIDVPEQMSMNDMSFPCVVKPNDGGSSVGVSLVHSEKDLTQAMNQTRIYGGDVLVEELVEGRELTVGVFDGEVLAVTEIVPESSHVFYDYDAKYAAGGSQHVVNPDLPKEVSERLMSCTKVAYEILKCKGVARADFMFDEVTGRTVFLEMNTLPGFTETSLIPEMAVALGYTFEGFVEEIMTKSLYQDYAKAI